MIHYHKSYSHFFMSMMVYSVKEAEHTRGFHVFSFVSSNIKVSIGVLIFEI